MRILLDENFPLALHRALLEAGHAIESYDREKPAAQVIEVDAAGRLHPWRGAPS